MKIAYDPGAKRLVPALMEMGYELFPYDNPAIPCDAVLYEKRAMPLPSPAGGSTLVVRSVGLTAEQVDLILRQRSYSPLLPRR